MNSCYVQTTTTKKGVEPPIDKSVDRCKLDLTTDDLTNCETMQLRWSYDKYLKRCRQIAGCRRNSGNNFDSMDECDYHCSTLNNKKEGKSCGAPPPLSEGTVVRKSFEGNASVEGDFVMYACNRGRSFKDDASKFFCSANGTWLSEEGTKEPECIPEAPCGAPQEVVGATIVSQSYSVVKDIVVGDFVEYRCNKGMKMWGQSYIVCQTKGKWSPAPKCQDLAQQNPQLSKSIWLKIFRFFFKINFFYHVGCGGRLSLADVSFCQLEVRYTFSAIQRRCLPFWGCPREQGNNFPTDEVCKETCESAALALTTTPKLLEPIMMQQPQPQLLPAVNLRTPAPAPSLLNPYQVQQQQQQQQPSLMRPFQVPQQQPQLMRPYQTQNQQPNSSPEKLLPPVQVQSSNCRMSRGVRIFILKLKPNILIDHLAVASMFTRCKLYSCQLHE